MKISLKGFPGFTKKQAAPTGVMQRLSKLQQPPTNLTQQILLHKHDAKNYRPHGVQPFDRAVRNFSWWAHVSGYTNQDIHDYLQFVLGVHFVR